MGRGALEPRTFRVPGKLMIAGEYSVLGPGGEALAIAVEPGIEAHAEPAQRWELLREESGLGWSEGQEVPPELSFACAALAAARKQTAATLSPHRLTLRILGEVGTGRTKPGVGGSASASVLVAAAVKGLAGAELSTSLDEVMEIALTSHRAIQGGQGSGYDVATVTYGGAVRWCPPRTAERLAWPGSLQMTAGYTGQSASTTELLRRLRTVEERDPVLAAAELRRLGGPVKELTRSLAGAGGGSSIQSILSALRECQRVLGAWDERLGLGVMTGAVSRMIEQAEQLGVVAKVSGAGGGDSVIAFAEDPELLHRVDRAWEEEGFRPLALEMSTRGAREERALETE